MYGAKPCYGANIYPDVQIKTNQAGFEKCPCHQLIPTKRSPTGIKAIPHANNFQCFTYKIWRQKPTGIDKKGNYVTVALCIVIPIYSMSMVIPIKDDTGIKRENKIGCILCKVHVCT